MGASVGQVGPGEVMVAQTELRAGGMGLWSIIAQAVTHIAPAMGFLTGATFIAANSGTGVSLAYFAAFLVCMAIGLTIIPLARYLPSAGGYFTYVSRTLGPRLGFITAWMSGMGWFVMRNIRCRRRWICFGELRRRWCLRMRWRIT